MEPYYETELGKLYHGDCLEIMQQLEPVDLVLTSPPYDNLRKYEGYVFNFGKTASMLRSLVVSGGVIVWVVADQTINGSETGSSFKQALKFIETGLNLHDTMFYKKEPIPLNHNRYEQAIEYMFVFSNGKPKVFNPILAKCVFANAASTGSRRHNLHDLEPAHKPGKVKSKKIKSNVWHYLTGFNKTTRDKFAYEHPAMFPEALARDHIISWTNKYDIVLDIFCGSGTTSQNV